MRPKTAPAWRQTPKPTVIALISFLALRTIEGARRAGITHGR
jgi:hypothetical protein